MTTPAAPGPVGVVIVTRGRRPALLRAAVRAVRAQDHPVEVVVVTDPAPGDDPARLLREVASQITEAGEPRTADTAGTGARGTGGPVVRVLANRRAPGLPGARNTGIAALSTDLVAFCDDDDEWLPGKLSAQMAALASAPGAEFASCAIEVAYGARRTVRTAGTEVITAAALRRSRMVMVHSSTFLFRRGTLWVAESAPRGQNEDWDLALRAAARRPIVHVDRPLVRVRWGGSDFATRWADRIAGLEWMLARHTDLAVDPRGAARIYGQLAFLHAAMGHRRTALNWAARATAARPAEPRTPLALAVATGLVSAPRLLALLHARGHGI